MPLIDAIPTKVLLVGRNEWLFTFGEGASATTIGREVGAVYLLSGNPHYTRFKVIATPREKDSDQPVIPAYHLISERPLTDEEIAYFERLAQTYSP